MKKKVLFLIAVAMVAALTLSSCKLDIQRDEEDVFAGEYVLADQAARETIAESIYLKADGVKDKNLKYVTAINATLETGDRTYDLGAKLEVLRDFSGENEVKFTYFTFGGFGKEHYIKDEFFIYYLAEENATYYEERATVYLSDAPETESVKYKNSDYEFDAYGFAKEKGYDFYTFGKEDVRDLTALAALVASGTVDVYHNGDDRIKIYQPLDSSESDYDGCAYYVYLYDDGFTMKIVMTYTDGEGNKKETDKTVEITTTDENAVLPEDLNEYEEKE